MKFPRLKLPFGKKNKQYFTVVDVGSSSVKVGIYKRATELTSQKLVGMGQQEQGIQAMYGGYIRDLDAVIATASVALEQASLQAGVAVPRQSIFGMSGGLLCSEGFRVRTNRTNPNEPIDDKEFTLVADNIETQTVERSTQKLLDLYHVPMKRVETSFTQYKVDGARVDTPIGITGTQLEVCVLHYFAEESHINLVNSLAHQVGLDVVSLLDTAVQTAVSIAKDKKQCVLIDAGGSVTSVVVITDGKVERSVPVFMGGEDYVWALQRGMDINRDTALSLMYGYTQGNLDDDRARTVRQTFEDVSDWMVEAVSIALSSMGLTHLPPALFVTGELRYVRELSKALSAYPWKGTPFSGDLVIETVPSKTPNLDTLSEVAMYLL